VVHFTHFHSSSLLHYDFLLPYLTSPYWALAPQEWVTECINDVSTWMRSNRLHLNAAKTEVLWYASGRHQGQLPDASFTIFCDAVKPVRLFEILESTWIYVSP